MKKLADLRAHLLAKVPALQRGPERLLTFIEDGTIQFWRGGNLTHKYRVRARVIVTDYRGEADDIVVPVLEWLTIREPGLDPEEAMSIEAEILANDAIDLGLTIPLTQRVIVREEEGERVIEHVLPPPPLEMDPDAKWQINPEPEEPGDE